MRDSGCPPGDLGRSGLWTGLAGRALPGSRARAEQLSLGCPLGEFFCPAQPGAGIRAWLLQGGWVLKCGIMPFAEKQNKNTVGSTGHV